MVYCCGQLALHGSQCGNRTRSPYRAPPRTGCVFFRQASREFDSSLFRKVRTPYTHLVICPTTYTLKGAALNLRIYGPTCQRTQGAGAPIQAGSLPRRFVCNITAGFWNRNHGIDGRRKKLDERRILLDERQNWPACKPAERASGTKTSQKTTQKRLCKALQASQLYWKRHLINCDKNHLKNGFFL